MPTGETHALHKFQAFVKLSVTLAGDADDHIRGNRHVRDGRPRGCQQGGKRVRRRLARHAAQSGRTAGLQRQVQVAAQARVLPQVEEPGLQVPGLQRGQAQARLAAGLQHGGDQVAQVPGWRKILAPGA